MSFLVWRGRIEEGHCALSPAAMGAFLTALERGDTMPEDLSQRVVFRMSDLFPDSIELSDNQVVANQIVISSSLRSVLSTVLPAQSTQYLKVKILNHKGRVAADDYTLLHPREVCDCIDLQASEVKWNPIAKHVIRKCARLIIREEAIPPQLQVFRLKHWPAKVLVRKSLAARLEEAGFVGLRFIEPAKYAGIG
jgi:hypothetical protein